jgi:hypothetical protein
MNKPANEPAFSLTLILRIFSDGLGQKLNIANAFYLGHSFQPPERVIPESNGNRFSLSPGERAGVRAGFKPKLN